MILKEYLNFLKEYKVVGLALGVIMGGATNDLVNSLVDNIVMPLLTPFFGEEKWEEAVLEIGPVVLSWGKFISEFINFTILAFVVFFVVKKLLKWDKIKS